MCISRLCTFIAFSLFFYTYADPQALHSFPTRRSSDLTTARILARALNYEMADGSVKGPSIHMPTLGVHCQAIMESRHMDVRSEEHTSELQSRLHLVCRLLLEKKKKKHKKTKQQNIYNI